MNPRHSVAACVLAFASALIASTAPAAPPCARAATHARPSLERAGRWAQAAHALPAPGFEEAWSPEAARAFGQRYHQWRDLRLALVAGAAAEWLYAAGVFEVRPNVRCFAELAARGGSFPYSRFDASRASWEVLLDLGLLGTSELNIATWARLGRQLTELVAEERLAEDSYHDALPPLEKHRLGGYFGSLGPYNEVETSVARKALVACVEQSTALRTWTTDSEECEQLRARFFRAWSSPPALDELREPPGYVDFRAPGHPVLFTRPALPRGG